MLELSLAQLRARYVEIFGEAPRTRNRVQLVRRIAWRLQAREHGDLSERAKRRAEELATDTDFRLGPPLPHKVRAASRGREGAAAPTDGMPVPGASITRQYKGKLVYVTVLADAFEYEGAHYKSLSAVAKAVTGAHWNGRAFFGFKAAAKREEVEA